MPAVGLLSVVMALLGIEAALLSQWAAHQPLTMHLGGWRYLIAGGLWMLNYFRFVRRADADPQIDELDQRDPKELRGEFIKMWAVVVGSMVLPLVTFIVLRPPK